jgi:hypothetical protein
MPLTNSEKTRLLLELQKLQQSVPAVQVRVDHFGELLRIGQARVDEIEAMLLVDDATRTPPAELDP